MFNNYEDTSRRELIKVILGVLAIPAALSTLGAIGFGTLMWLHLLLILVVFSQGSLASCLLFALTSALVVTGLNALIVFSTLYVFKNFETTFNNWLTEIAENPLSLYAFGSYTLIGVGLLAVTTATGAVAFFALSWTAVVAPSILTIVGALEGLAIGLSTYALIVSTLSAISWGIFAGINYISNQIISCFSAQNNEEVTSANLGSTSYGSMYQDHPEMRFQDSDIMTKSNARNLIKPAEPLNLSLAVIDEWDGVKVEVAPSTPLP
ncbi:MAG: hypothetical protein EPN84_07940 [Legionella sp.]|nr:MAG: hypothetical protein EPN84_07940 [Legionella sp.]